MRLLIALATCGLISAGIAIDASARRTSAQNNAAAVSDATRLLAGAPLPPGSVRVSSEPSGDGGLLGHPLDTPVTPALVDRYGWWTTSTSFADAVAYLRAHPPAGGMLTGFVGGLAGPPNGLMFSFSPRAGVLSSRSLAYSLVALSGGGTGIRIDAMDIWIVARPADERIPAGVRAIEWTRTRWTPRGAPNGRVLSRRTIARRATVERIVGLFNRMDLVQPGVLSCPAERIRPVNTFTFRGRHGTLAQARVDGFLSDECNAIALSIRGRRQTPLVGGTYLKRVQRLLP